MLDDQGDAVEADLLRYYRVDLLDFYRGKISPRRLGLLIRQLPAESAVVRALNDNQQPMSRLEHFTADLWSLWAKKEHPVRAAIEEKAHTQAKRVRVIELRARFEKRKQTYGLGE